MSTLSTTYKISPEQLFLNMTHQLLTLLKQKLDDYYVENCEATNVDSLKEVLNIILYSSSFDQKLSDPLVNLNVLRLIGIITSEVKDIDINSYLIYTALLIMDNYFINGSSEVRFIFYTRHKIQLYFLNKKKIYTPDRGFFQVEAKGDNVKILVKNKELEYLNINEKNLKVIDFGKNKIICVNFNDKMIIDYPDSLDIEEDGDVLNILFKQIKDSMFFIKCIDSELFNRVCSLIKYVVPLKYYNNQIHHSSSSPLMIGCIFTSIYDPNKIITLSEALVHEYHHNELNLFMYLTNLFKENSINASYYSPWRDDPRPLYGLFHAIYVFSEIIEFVAKVNDYALKNHTNKMLFWVNSRYEKQIKQLLIALDQIDVNMLTQNGNTIIEAISNNLYKHYKKLKNPNFNSPLSNLAHIIKWKKNNINYLSGLNLREDIRLALESFDEISF